MFNAFFDLDAGVCNKTSIAKLEAAFVKTFNAIPDTNINEQAIAFRTFVLQPCIADMNPIFSGNGFTYTGFGGLLAPTSPEVITGSLDLGKLDYSVIQFCINGAGKPVDGACVL